MLHTLAKRHPVGFVISLFLITALHGGSALADVRHVEIEPSAARADTQRVHGPHLVAFDPDAKARHRLVVYLSGTNGVATEATPIVDALARDGYHVISLDYPNGVQAAQFRVSRDPGVFDRYRQALVRGGKINDAVTIGTSDSIEARLGAVLRHLATVNARDGFDQYATPKGIVWEKLVLVGHSQGAGHAAFLAHDHSVAKVLIIAGPQDYLTALERPAPWLGAASKTPRKLFRALLHREDEYDVKLQIAANRALAQPPKARVVNFAAETPVALPAPAILVSERPLDETQRAARTRDPKAAPAHVSLVQAPYAPVWLYLLAN